MITECQQYKEVETVAEALRIAETWPAGDGLFQLKYDGIWARNEITDAKNNLYSKTAMHKTCIHLNTLASGLSREPMTLIGEYMMSSQWSQAPERKSTSFIFDCTQLDGKDIRTLPYNQRYRLAQSVVKDFDSKRMAMVPCYDIGQLERVFAEIQRLENWEGVVLRRWSSTYYTELIKLKREVEDDFVIMGFVPGDGRLRGYLGALSVGQFDESGNLVSVMNVGGGFNDVERQIIYNRQERYLNQVIKVKGKARFTSGALRHPNVCRLACGDLDIRLDKLPHQCLLKRTSVS